MSRQLFLRLPFVEQKDSFRLASVSEDTGDLLEALETLIPADSRFFWTVSGLRTPLGHGLSLLDVCGHDNEAFPLNLTLHPRVLGGKGGFGTQLKSQAGRMSRKRRGEKANLGSCRDLSGRRLRTLDEAQQ